MIFQSNSAVPGLVGSLAEWRNCQEYMTDAGYLKNHRARPIS